MRKVHEKVNKESSCWHDSLLTGAVADNDWLWTWKSNSTSPPHHQSSITIDLIPLICFSGTLPPVAGQRLMHELESLSHKSHLWIVCVVYAAAFFSFSCPDISCLVRVFLPPRMVSSKGPPWSQVSLCSSYRYLCSATEDDRRLFYHLKVPHRWCLWEFGHPPYDKHDPVIWACAVWVKWT